MKPRHHESSEGYSCEASCLPSPAEYSRTTSSCCGAVRLAGCNSRIPAKRSVPTRTDSLSLRHSSLTLASRDLFKRGDASAAYAYVPLTLCSTAPTVGYMVGFGADKGNGLSEAQGARGAVTPSEMRSGASNRNSCALTSRRLSGRLSPRLQIIPKSSIS